MLAIKIVYRSLQAHFISHNSKAFEDAVDGYPSSEIRNVITMFKKAQTVLNDSNSLIWKRIDKTKKIVQSIQRTTLNYLKQFLKVG